MQISVYVVYELLIRLQELHPGVGEYVSSKKMDEGITVYTSTGMIFMSDHILSRQFEYPSGISQQEILDLLEGFKLSVNK